MTDIKAQRDRVIKAIAQKTRDWGDSPTRWDYFLDDFARGILGLPERPKKALPYIGWLVRHTKPSPSLDPVQKKVSAKGLSLIKKYEGLRLKAYLCPAGVWTIGYGHTKNVRPGEVITTERALELLRRDLSVFEAGVNRLVKIGISQNEFDALVSFAFNCGLAALERSSLLRKLNAGDRRGAAAEFGKWVNANGKKLAGLVRRRDEERLLFRS